MVLIRPGDEEGQITPLLKNTNTPVDSYVTTNEHEENDTDAELEKQSWNDPPENVAKTVVAFIGFIIMGLTDSAIGALLPSLEDYYELSDYQVSFAFLAPTGGYLLSAVCSTWIHYKIGRGGLSILGIALQLLNFLVVGTRPSFPVLLLSFSACGLGSGLVNGSWNAWVGAFRAAHGILGVLQGFYAIGAFIGPAIITLILENEKPWNSYYQVLAIAACILLAFAIFSFKNDGPEEYKLELRAHSAEGDHENDATTWEALKSGKVILLSILLYAYQGTEMSMSDWIVTYMIRVRHGDPKRMGLMSSCLWFGLTAGRVGLGFVTGRFKDHKRVVTGYILLALVFQLTFWATDQLYVSALAIFAVGFFTGPVYPSAMIVATSILPKRLHVPGICAAVALSGVGSATLPVTIGAFVGAFGAWILQPLLFCFLIFLTTIWISIPSRRA